MSKIKIVYRLKEARKLNMLSLRAAANGLGMSHEGLSKFENGLLPMDSEKLIKFAKFYNVKPDYLSPNPNRPKIKFGKIHICKLNKKYV